MTQEIVCPVSSLIDGSWSGTETSVTFNETTYTYTLFASDLGLPVGVFPKAIALDLTTVQVLFSRPAARRNGEGELYAVTYFDGKGTPLTVFND